MRKNVKTYTLYSHYNRLLAWLIAFVMLIGQGNWAALAEGSTDVTDTVMVTESEPEAKNEVRVEEIPETAIPVDADNQVQPSAVEDGADSSEAPIGESLPEETPAEEAIPAEGENPAWKEVPGEEENLAEEDAPANEAKSAGDENSTSDEAEDRVIWRGYVRILKADDEEDSEVPLYQDSHTFVFKGMLRSGAIVAATRHANEDRYYVRFWADDEPWFGYIEPAALEQLNEEEEAAFLAESETLIVVDRRNRSFYDMTAYCASQRPLLRSKTAGLRSLNGRNAASTATGKKVEIWNLTLWDLQRYGE